MPTSIFSDSSKTVSLPSGMELEATPIISIVGRSAKSGSQTISSNLPLIAINDLSSTDRLQVDCSLDGVFHILKAKGGFGRGSLTFLDGIKNCASGSTFKSALKEYIRSRKKAAGSFVDVTLRLGGDKTTFSGYLTSCSVDVKQQQGNITYVFVTYGLIGDFQDD